MGRARTNDDLIVPARPEWTEEPYRNVNRALRRFHEDLARLGLRRRRQHDLRRTFVTIARSDGARKDVLEHISHGPRGDIMDMYTTLPWTVLCEEVAKLRISLREAGLAGAPALERGGEAAGGSRDEPDSVGAGNGRDVPRLEPAADRALEARNAAGAPPADGADKDERMTARDAGRTPVATDPSDGTASRFVTVLVTPLQGGAENAQKSPRFQALRASLHQSGRRGSNPRRPAWEAGMREGVIG